MLGDKSDKYEYEFTIQVCVLYIKEFHAILYQGPVGKENVDSVSTDIPKSSYCFSLMNFVFWQDRTVEVSLAPNQKTRDCLTQRAIADNEFPILWQEVSVTGLVEIHRESQ